MEDLVTRGVRGRRAPVLAAGLVASTLLALTAAAAEPPPLREAARNPPAAAPAPAPSADVDRPAAPTTPAARPVPDRLPVIDYGPAPRGFPDDPQPLSTAPLTEGLRPRNAVPLYDAPGGRPLAFLPPRISGVPLTVPVVKRRVGWTAVMLPSANRRIGWLPPPTAPPVRDGWATVRLRDQLVVVRRAHRLTWFRDGVPQRSWRVSLGARATPTPLGRTFVLGRSRLSSYVYADTDVFALGAVPDDPAAVPPGLRGAHIGIHAWYHDGELGRDTTDGCVRLTRKGQRQLLANLAPGTPVVVLDRSPGAGHRP